MVASGPDRGGTCWYCQTVRVRQARSEGVTRVIQWLTPRKCEAGSNLVDVGRSADMNPPTRTLTSRQIWQPCRGRHRRVRKSGHLRRTSLDEEDPFEDQSPTVR
jgi:hypothetical protein